MPKIEVKAVSKPHRSSDRLKYFVEITIDGVIFETEVDGAEKAFALATKTSKALGVGHKL